MQPEMGIKTTLFIYDYMPAQEGQESFFGSLPNAKFQNPNVKSMSNVK
jgi:hypothetical protein